MIILEKIKKTENGRFSETLVESCLLGHFRTIEWPENCQTMHLAAICVEWHVQIKLDY